MTMLWLGGRYANAIGTGNGVSASPSADSLFPTTGLYDRNSATICKFGSLSATPTFTADLDMLAGTGGFESFSGSSPVGWTEANTGTGDVTQQSVSGTLVHSGNFSARLAAGTGVASIYKDVVVRAGQHYAFTVALRGDGGLGRAQMVVRNINTGRYLLSGTWQDSYNEVLTDSGTPYTLYTPDANPSTNIFQVESASVCGTPFPTIRIQFFNDNATTVGYVDSLALYPGVTFCSVHGHNIDPRSAPEIHASTDNFVADDDTISTPTLKQPAFYSYFTIKYYRYWRIEFQDTNSAAIYVGEWVLGEHNSYAGPALPFQSNYSDQQVRVPRRFGAPGVFGMGQASLNALPMTLRFESTTDRDAFFQEWERCRGGYPTVVVPHDGNGHSNVIMGVVGDAWPESWATRTFVAVGVEIEPSPLPLVMG